MKKSKRFILAGTSAFMSAGLIIPLSAAPAMAAPSKSDTPSASKSYAGENDKRGYRGHNRSGFYNYKSPAGYTMPELSKCMASVQKDAKDNEDVDGLVAENPDTKSDSKSDTTTSAKKSSKSTAKSTAKSSAKKTTKTSLSPEEEKAKSDEEMGVRDNNAAIIANSEQADNLRSVVDQFTSPIYLSDIVGGSGVSAKKKANIEDSEFFTSQVVLALLTKDPKARQKILNNLPANVAADISTVLASISITDIVQMITYFARTGQDAVQLAAAITKIQAGGVDAVTTEMTRSVLNLTSDTLNTSAQSIYMLNKFFKVWNNLKVMPSLKDVYRILDPSTDAGAMFYCSIPKQYAKSQTFVKSLASLGEVARVGAMTDASHLSGYLSDLAGLVENLKVDLGIDDEARGSDMDMSEILKTGTSIAGAGGIDKASDALTESTSDAEKSTESMSDALGKTGTAFSPMDMIGKDANLADATEDTIWIILNAFDAVNVVYSLILPIADASVNAFINIALLNMPGNNDLPGIGKQINKATPQFDKALEPVVKQLGLKTASENRKEKAAAEKSSAVKSTATKAPAKKAKAPSANGSSDAVTDKSAVKSLTGIASRSAKLAEKQGELSGDDKMIDLSDKFKKYNKAVKKGKSTAPIFES